MNRVVEVISNVVDAMNDAAANDVQVKFYYGHPTEIVATLSEMLKSPSYQLDRFPAVCVMMDFEERMNEDGYHCITEPTIVIVTDTKPEYKASERYLNSFDNTLYPIYDLFMEYLERSTELDVGRRQFHTKTDRLYWGKTGLYGNSGNMFNDFIDAIEIQDLEIKVLKS